MGNDKINDCLRVIKSLKIVLSVAELPFFAVILERSETKR